MRPETYRAEQEATATATKTRVQRLLNLSVFGAGLMSVSEFLEMASTTVSTANVIATVRADRFISGLLDHSPLGVGRPTSDVARITNALELITESPEPSARIGRLAFSEPLSSAQSASREVIADAGITHYYWQTDSDPCGLCTSLTNSIHPVGKAAIVHPGCSCVLLPVTPEGTTDD